MNTSNISKKAAFSFDVSSHPPLPRLPGLLVTGTDTGVGKTLVAGAIAAHLHERGRAVEVFKPVATGCRRSREGLISEDAEFLAACSDSRRSLAEISPLRYAPACAPNLAAKIAHRPIELDEIFAAYRSLQGAADAVIVEGIGGLLCPITDDFWVIHLARMMALPLVIVARAHLGTINHTLLTIHAARSAGLEVAGVVVNGYMIEPRTFAEESAGRTATNDTDDSDAGGDDTSLRPQETSSDLTMETNPAQIAKLGKVDILAIVPQEADNSVRDVRIGRDTRFAISQGPWEKIVRVGRAT